MDCNLLKSKRILNGITQKELARHIGISEKCYNHKEQNKVEFKVNEIKIISDKLQLTVEDINKIFFDSNLPFV